MTNIIVALPKLEDARNIKNVLVRNGFQVTGICTTGAGALELADDLNQGIVLCSYRLKDMIYAELRDSLPPDFELLLMASQHLLAECHREGIVCLPMPLKTQELVHTVSMMAQSVERRKRQKKGKPKARDPKEEAVIVEAKKLLMSRNQMTEEEAHRYLQRCSMESGTNLVETAQMVLVLNGR